MAKLTPPTWAPDAVPTTRGWVRGRELLKSQAISQADIDEYLGVGEEVQSPSPTMLTEAPSAGTIENMDDPAKEALEQTTGIRGFVNNLLKD